MKRFLLIQSLFGAILCCYAPHSMFGKDADLQTKIEEDYRHGFVLDAAGAPLPYATVTAWQGDRFLTGTTTNEEGFFELESGEATLAISFIGYETQRLSTQELVRQPLIQLQASAYELEMVVVRGLDRDTERIYSCCCSIISRTTEVEPEAEPAPGLAELHFFPNPTVDYVQVMTTSEGGTLRLFSGEGRLLRTEVIENQAHRFDLSSYPAGSYFLSYEQAGQLVQSKSVIKLKK